VRESATFRDHRVVVTITPHQSREIVVPVVSETETG